MKIWLLMCIMALATSVQADLKCYVCDNCADLGDTALSTCQMDTTTTAETTTEEDETTTVTTTVELPEEESQVRLAHIDNLSAAAQLLQNYRAGTRTKRATSDVVFACYTITIHETDANRVQRGCVELPDNTEGCDAVVDQISIDKDKTSDCSVCQNDGCNSSAMIRLSFIAFVFVLLAKVFI